MTKMPGTIHPVYPRCMCPECVAEHEEQRTTSWREWQQFLRPLIELAEVRDGRIVLRDPLAAMRAEDV